MNFNLGVPEISPISSSSLATFGGSPAGGDSLGGVLRSFGVGEGSSDLPIPGVNVGEALAQASIGGVAPKSKLSQYLGDFGSGVSILGDLAQIYLGFQANKMAKKELATQTGFANANLENTVKSYNTRLADIRRARGHTQGDSAADIEAGITANSLDFKRIG
jgi:hypothetical protein